ncbi:MAG: hypothetical protein NVS2B17_31670 [Candidatus Velthaea sp.]
MTSHVVEYRLTITDDIGVATIAIQAQAQDGVQAAAKSFLDADVRTYGLAPSGELYEAMLRYLTQLDFHAFRLNELFNNTGDHRFNGGPVRLLDLGCGPGTLVLTAAQRGHDAFGVDLGAEKLALAAAWLDALDAPAEMRSRIMQRDAGDLPFDEGSFDLVTSYHVLEHVNDLPSVLYEAVRVTKHGGWLDLRAPDYRMSYDTHYCMPWPRFMPPAQARAWAQAMGRPSDGVGTFFGITAPQVAAILESLGCRIVKLSLNEHQRGHVRPFSGTLQIDPIIFRSDRDVTELAKSLLDADATGSLPAMYSTCLEFTIIAQRL